MAARWCQWMPVPKEADIRKATSPGGRDEAGQRPDRAGAGGRQWERRTPTDGNGRRTGGTRRRMISQKPPLASPLRSTAHHLHVGPQRGLYAGPRHGPSVHRHPAAPAAPARQRPPVPAGSPKRLRPYQRRRHPQTYVAAPSIPSRRALTGRTACSNLRPLAKAPSVRRACTACHAGKTRCSEVLPCQVCPLSHASSSLLTPGTSQSCLKRGLGAACAYPDPDADSSQQNQQPQPST